MELFDHIRKISFVFFVTTGIAHFTAGFFAINGYFGGTSSLINRILFIPFVMTALTFVLSNVKCQLMENGNTSKHWDYAFLSLGGVVFLALLAMEFFLADSPHPLLP